MIAVALLLLPVASLRAVSTAAVPGAVGKVVKLLTDMQTQLQADKKADEEMYDKLSCWCKVNGEGKGTAVEIAEGKIADLDSRIKALTAKSSELDESIKKVEAEVAANMQALESATSMRDKGLTKFRDDEKDMIVSITNLKNALVVLEKNLDTSFLQMSSDVKTRVRDVMSSSKADDILQQILNPSQRDTVTAFMQGQVTAGSPQGGEIMGILKQMKTEFESNLADMQATEKKDVAEFAALKDAKTSEIAAGEEMAKEKTALLGKTKVQLAEAKEDFEDTTSAMEADQAFLVDLKERCSVSDSEWEERSKTRSLEIAAVGETIKILTDEDAHDLFSSTLSFLQLSSTRRTLSREEFTREQASRVLLKSGVKSGRRALVQLSAGVRLDAFVKVEKEINGMISDIEAESASEVALQDKCKEEFHKNDMETMEIDETISDLTTKINDFASAIDTLTKEIAALKAEITETTINIQRANELRVKSNKEFQSAVADQRATQAILKKALDRLGDFYAEQFVQLKAKHRLTKQEPGAAAPPPPQAPDSEYKSNSGSGSVMTMIEGIITDAKNMEKESIKDEQDAEAAYQSFLSESFASIEAAQRAVTNKVEEKATAESGKTAAEGDKADAEATKEALGKTLADLHSSCDFVMDNFDAREMARKSEIEGLQNTMSALKTA
jgi:hypothetical protein